MSNVTPTPGSAPLPPLTPDEPTPQAPVDEQLNQAALYHRFVRSLDVGQVVSAAVILLALALIIAGGDDLPRETVAFTRLLDPVLEFDGDAMLSLGILTLILTPLVYVGAGLYTFLRERDRLFITVTLVLVGILATSVLLASL